MSLKRILHKGNELLSRPTYQYLALAIITLIATILRFYKLGDWGFWTDEVFTISGEEDGFNYSLLRQSTSMKLIQTTIAFLGVNEWSARLIPALIGIISIPILYFAVRKMFNPPTGMLAVLFLAISPWHLFWSQSARYNVALLLFYTLALFTFYFALEEDRPGYYLLSLVLLGLAVKERLQGLFFVPVILGYLALLLILPFEKPAGLRRWRNLALFFGLPNLILASVFAWPYLRDLSGWMGGFGVPNNNPLWLLVGIVYHIGFPAVCVAGLGALYLLLQKSRAGLLLSLGAIVPVLLLIAAASFHATAHRYAFLTLASYLILAAAAAVELLRQSPNNLKILAAGALILLLLDPFKENMLYYGYQNGHRDNWKEAFAVVKDHKQAGDLVVTSDPEVANYYLQEKTSAYEEINLATIGNSGRRVWFVEDTVVGEDLPQVSTWLEQNARPVANLDFPIEARISRMRVYIYDVNRN